MFKLYEQKKGIRCGDETRSNMRKKYLNTAQKRNNIRKFGRTRQISPTNYLMFLLRTQLMLLQLNLLVVI
jgi:hypothetical protein